MIATNEASVAGGNLNAAYLCAQPRLSNRIAFNLKFCGIDRYFPNNAITADKHPGTIRHVNIINDEIITAINCDAARYQYPHLPESAMMFLALIANDEMFAIFAHQLSAIRSGNIGHHKVLLPVFRITIVIGATRQPDADPQLILPLVQSRVR